jgi:hypothetical protein
MLSLSTSPFARISFVSLQNRDFQTVTIALSVGFVVVFWCFIAMGSCASCYLKDQELRREVVALQAQGIEVG